MNLRHPGGGDNLPLGKQGLGTGEMHQILHRT